MQETIKTRNRSHIGKFGLNTVDISGLRSGVFIADADGDEAVIVWYSARGLPEEPAMLIVYDDGSFSTDINLLRQGAWPMRRIGDSIRIDSITFAGEDE